MINIIQNKKKYTFFGVHSGYYRHGFIKYDDGSQYNKYHDFLEGYALGCWKNYITYDYYEYETMFNLNIEYKLENDCIVIYEYRL